MTRNIWETTGGVPVLVWCPGSTWWATVSAGSWTSWISGLVQPSSSYILKLDEIEPFSLSFIFFLVLAASIFSTLWQNVIGC